MRTPVITHAQVWSDIRLDLACWGSEDAKAAERQSESMRNASNSARPKRTPSPPIHHTTSSTLEADPNEDPKKAKQARPPRRSRHRPGAARSTPRGFLHARRRRS